MSIQICPSCLAREAEPDTVNGGCVHYWQHRCDDLSIALYDLAGEVNDTRLDTYEYPELFDAWMRATTTLAAK